MKADQEIIRRINQICSAYPKQFSKILHARNNTRLVDYINDWCEPLAFGGILFSTKVYYAVNQVTAFPVCENCGKQIVKNVYRLFNPRLSFCDAQCKHAHTIRTKGVSRIYERKCTERRKKESDAYVIPAADDYEDAIRDIVRAHPYGFMNIFKHPSNSRLREWLDQKFPQLDGYELRTKINWVLHGTVDFPVC